MCSINIGRTYLLLGVVMVIRLGALLGRRAGRYQGNAC